MPDYQLIERNENTAKRIFLILCVFGVDSMIAKKLLPG